MPAFKLILILFVVILTAGLSIWLGAVMVEKFGILGSDFTVVLPLSLLIALTWRVISTRSQNRRDKSLNGNE